MPLYTFQCSNGHRHTIYSKIDHRDDTRQCESCGANLLRQVEAPYVQTDITPYRSPVDGHWVNSKTERREDLRRNNSIEWEPGIRQDLPRLKAEADEKAFAPMAKTIEDTARNLISAGKLDPL